MTEENGTPITARPANPESPPANEFGIKAVTVWLPPGRETPAEGGLSSPDIERVGVRELSVATDIAPPQMAVLAAKGALEKSGIDPESIGYVAHAHVYYQGLDFWSPAHYIAHHSGIPGALPVTVQQLSNGGALALHLAGMWLAADPGASTALVTTADRFCLPGFNRWASDDEAVYADSGTAVLLGRRGGDGDLLHLLALELVTDAQWEIQWRGDDEFTPAPLGHGSPIDIRRRKKVFAESGGAARMANVAVEKLYGTIMRCLQKANIKAEDIDCVAIPRLTPHMRDNVFIPGMKFVLGRELRFLESNTGHFGAGDFAANMTDMVDSLSPGEIGLIFQGGGGFTFSCAIVQAPPDHGH